jgi:fatty acid desaturase
MSTFRTRRAHHLSRAAICLLVAVVFGSFFWQPVGPLAWLADVALHTYLGFLGTVLAHEGAHGHLGRGRGNLFWGRLALLPVMVPFANFRRTHPLHHAHTNLPGRDPDQFIEPRFTRLELPLRALAMPHQWLFWLRARGRMGARDLAELGRDYVLIAAVWTAVGVAAGPGRVLACMAPSLVLVSLILWVPFAFMTHEGFSTGDDPSRSHDYYGAAMYWLSLGLSMHRAHHMHPELPWLELRSFVRSAPVRGWRALLPRRDMAEAAS